MAREYPETNSYSGLAVAIAALAGVLAAVASAWVANGFATNFEELFRVAPTVESGGVGSDWVAGNTLTWLDFLVAITHAVDVLMGVFILVMVFIHWAAFRRLAGRMRKPGGRRREGVATDGGTDDDERTDDETVTDGGVPADGTASDAAADRRGDRGD
jgi:hypothetical protein